MSDATKPIHPIDVSNELIRDGKYKEAHNILLGLQMQDPEDGRVKFNLGWFECIEGNWKAAQDLLDVGRYLDAYGSPPLANGAPIWRDEDLRGKTVLFRAEGGFGDEIIQARFIRDLAKLGARVVVSCNKGLRPLFARIPGAAAVVSHEAAPHVLCDYWVPAMSSMRWFAPTGETYLTPDAAHVKKWKPIMHSDRALKIGIRWGGNPKFEHEQRRRFPEANLIDLAAQFREHKFYSLQRDNDVVDLPDDITNLETFIATWEDTAAAISQMDLVISSCTSVCHLAAALGVETWAVVPMPAYYTWAVPGPKTQWYDSVTIFRQVKRGSWTEPFDDVRAMLRRRALRNVA